MYKVCRILLLLVILLAEGICFPASWGALVDYHQPSEKKGQEVGSRYLLRQILQGKPIVVNLVLEFEDKDKKEDLQKLIRQSYNQWFSYPAEVIRKQKRQSEFADVLPILNKGVNVQFSDKNPDIYVFVKNYKDIFKTCAGVGAGCYMFGQESNNFIPEIYIPKDNFFMQILTGFSFSKQRIALHEIGHSLGLSDQYATARDNNSHPVYRSSKPAESVMETRGSLTCDDVDGIINLIDITRKTTRGEDTGWRSFCKDSKDYYSHGKVLANSPYYIDFDKETEQWTLLTVDGENLQKEASFPMDLQAGVDPFFVSGEKIFRRDASNRPVRARTANGEEVYYSYVYDKKTRLVVRDGKAVLVEIWSPAWHNTKWRSFPGKQHEVYFGGDGKNRSLVAAFYKRHGGGLEYTEGKGFFVHDKTINVNFDKKREIEYEEWSGYEDGTSAAPQAPTLPSAAKPTADLEDKIKKVNQRKKAEQLRKDLLKWYEKVK